MRSVTTLSRFSFDFRLPMSIDRKIELTPYRQLKLTHLVIKCPPKGGGKRGGKHVQMATYQSIICPGGQHQKNSQNSKRNVFSLPIRN